MVDPQPFNPYASPDLRAPSAPMPTMSRRLQLKRVGVWSCAKMFGALYAIMGLVLGGFFSLFAMSGAALSPNSGPGSVLGAGVGAVIIFPLLYGVGGIIAGAFMGALYNIVAGAAGGIEMHLSDA